MVLSGNLCVCRVLLNAQCRVLFQEHCTLQCVKMAGNMNAQAFAIANSNILCCRPCSQQCDNSLGGTSDPVVWPRASCCSCLLLQIPYFGTYNPHRFSFFHLVSLVLPGNALFLYILNIFIPALYIFFYFI